MLYVCVNMHFYVHADIHICTYRHMYIYIYAFICICMSGCSPSAKDGLYPKGSTVLAAAEHRAKQVVSVVARAWA